MAEINCPMCDRPNPAELDICQFCEAQLKPVTDQLSRSQPPIKPGEDPTYKDTGELESVLPQWLRDVRQQSRESADESEEQAKVQKESHEEPPQQEDEAPEFDLLAGLASQSEEKEEPQEFDLLAGLASQAEEKEEVPDWLARIQGDAKTEEADDGIGALESLLGGPPEEVAKEEETFGDVPDWMADLQKDETPQTGEFGGFASSAWGEGDTSASSPDESLPTDFGSFDAPLPGTVSDHSLMGTSDLPDWLQSKGAKDAHTEEPIPAPPPAEEPALPAVEGDLPDWLAGLGGEAPPSFDEEPVQSAVEGEAPDWLSTLGEEETTEEPILPVADGEPPDWFSSLGGDVEEAAPAFGGEPAASALEGEAPDWLSTLGAEETTEEPILPVADGEPPDWLSSLDGEDATELKAAEESFSLAAGGEDLDWLSTLGGDETETSSSSVDEPVTPAVDGETPDWLSSLGGEDATELEAAEESFSPAAGGEDLDWLSALGGDETETPSSSVDEPVTPARESETPDWLSSLGGEETVETEATVPVEEEPVQLVEEEPPDWLSSLGGETSTEESVVPAFTDEPYPAAPEVENQPAFVNDEGAPISSGDMDAIFSMEMPDWLEDVGGAQQIDAETAETPAMGDDLSPASLPSWVQAMRPVESVIVETSDEDDQNIEEKGPLAGLRGVLPPVPDFSPSSKPKAYTLKLIASTEQQESAALLERLLTSEEHPVPIKSQVQVLSQRVLRWLIAAVMLLVVSGLVFSGTQLNPMPVGLTREAWAAVQLVEGVPENAPVLLIFDYEAALAGELEVSAAPLIDHMLLLKHPRLALLASKATGVGLAERFMTNTQAGHNYLGSQQMLNLGYLPGGPAGALGFAENPAATIPLSADGQLAWSTPTLQGVSGLFDFAAIILLTDDADNARSWIEQFETKDYLGNASLIVVSSAQSGPMILPYLQSGQVDGMVVGMDNGASVEQFNAGRPGLVRRYWDAYGFGLLTAVLIIVMGSLWSLISGWQARRAQSGEE